MRRLSADSRREFIDWIFFSVSGEELYGDERDVQPIDWDVFSIEQWNGRRYEAQLRRKRLTALSDSNLFDEAWRYYENQQLLAALMPRKRGRPTGAGSLAKADEPLIAEITKLTNGGLSLHAATQIVASRAPGGGANESKARRLARRISEKK